jgi:hypothetical protein
VCLPYSFPEGAVLAQTAVGSVQQTLYFAGFLTQYTMKIGYLRLLPILNFSLGFGLQRSGSFCFRNTNVNERKLSFAVLHVSLKDGEEEEEDPWAQEDLARTRTTVTTSFGSESVPQEQRPTNEYLNLLQQPLFGWASQETGNIGLFQRLVLSYLAIFSLV